MFGAVHFIYCINISKATKVDSTYLGYYTTVHNVYMFDDRCAQTSPSHTRHRLTSRHHMVSSSTETEINGNIGNTNSQSQQKEQRFTKKRP